MLKRIIAGSKKLFERAKKPFITTLAGLTLLAATSGCKSMGKEWKTIYTDSQTIEKGEFEFHKVKYKITKPDILEDNILSIPILESRTIETYKQREIITEEIQKEYDNKKSYQGTTTAIISFIPGFIFGFWLGYEGLKTKETYVRSYPGIPKTRYNKSPFLGLLLGIGAGGGTSAAGYHIAGKDPKIEIPTGNKRTITIDTSTIKELTNTETKPESLAETDVLITSQDVKFKELNESQRLPQKEITVYSKNGDAKVKIIEDILEFEFKKQDLIDQIKEWKSIKQIKEPTRSQLLPSILEYIINQNYQINIKTSNISTEWRRVTNDKRTISVSGYRIPAEKIYLVLEDFIGKEINSKIKEARIRLIDESTHTSVQDANLDIETEAPSKTDLAKQYFEEDLLEWSIAKIRDYITGQETMKYDSNGEAVFSVYTLSAYKTESTHSKYAFARFNFDFSNPKNLKQTIEMSQDPLKIKKVDK